MSKASAKVEVKQAARGRTKAAGAIVTFTTLDYLQALYQAWTPGALLAYVKEPFTRRFGYASGLPKFSECICQLNEQYDVYLTVNALDGKAIEGRSPFARGLECEVTAIVALVADVDAEKPGHNYPPQPHIIDALAEMPLRASIIVVSGQRNGGLHAYWLLTEPFIIRSDEDRARLKRASKEWQQLLRTKLAPYELDSTHDLVRVLRPIGTTNKKYGSTVSALVFEPDRRFTVAEFEQHLPPTARARIWTPPVNIDHGTVIDRAARYVAKIPGAVSGQGGHNATFSVAMRLIEGFALSVNDAMPIMQAWSATCEPPWDEPDLMHKLESADARAERRGYLINQCEQSGNGAMPSSNGDHRSVNSDSRNTDSRNEPSKYWEPNIVPMNSIEPRAVQWLWKYRIPNGKLVSLSGNPGLGKTLVLMDIAAHVTTGAAWPDGEPGGDPGGVVICSAEDDPHDTLRPRLDAAGADVSRINLVQSVVLMDPKSKKKSERLIDLQQDRDAIGKAMDLTANCKLLIMDPINAYLGKTDSHKNAEVRQVLGPVAELCHRKCVAFIYLGHLNKTTNGPALYRAAGSIAFVAAARVAYMVVESKDDSSIRLFLPVKNNLAPNIGGLSFQVVAVNDLPRIEWNDTPVTTTADEALATDSRGVRGNLEHDKEWLNAQLANGAMESTEIFELGKAVGISRNRLFKAKEAIGAAAKKNGFGADSVFEWFIS